MGFWGNLFEELVIWNEEEATRHSSNARNHSIIDVTASTPGEWAMGGAEEATDQTMRSSSGGCKEYRRGTEIRRVD